MASILLDSNVLMAVSIGGHVHHDAADRWLAGTSTQFATCPITEGSLVREILRRGDGIDVALNVLRGISGHHRHEFWADDVSYVELPTAGLFGHKQVTDAYLAHLARGRGSRLATLDSALAGLHPDVAELVPTS